MTMSQLSRCCICRRKRRTYVQRGIHVWCSRCLQRGLPLICPCDGPGATLTCTSSDEDADNLPEEVPA